MPIEENFQNLTDKSDDKDKFFYIESSHTKHRFRKPDKEKTEVKLVRFDKIAKCDAVFVEEAEIKRLLPGFFDINKRTDVWPIDFQNAPKPEPEHKTIKSMPDKVQIKKGLMQPPNTRHRQWQGHGKRPMYLQWNEFRIVK